LKNVSQYMMMVDKQEEKPRLLQTLIQKLDVQNILVFGNNKERLHELKDFLDKEGYKVAFIYQKDGEQSNQVEFMEQQTRDFIQGKYRILLVTNLYARGIDMRKVTLVVNYNLPLLIKENDRTREVDLPTYLHRVGRTGRFGDKGIAINLVEHRDLELIEKIQECYKNEIKLLETQSLDEVNETL
jgi:ATP-dependent RNA helicase DDX19/DBP5